MARRVLFIGRPKPEHLAPALSSGLEVAALVPRGKPPPAHAVAGGAGAVELVAADLEDDDAAVGAAIAFARARPVDGCLTRFESLVPLTARVADALGLPGTGVAAALRARDKLRMRRALAAGGVPQPGFAGVAGRADLDRAADALGFPLLVKPLSGAHSRHVSVYRTPEEVAAEFEPRARALSGDRARVLRRAPAAGARWIAEQLVTGRQVTTTTVIAGDDVHHVALVDVVTTRDLGRGGFQLVTRTTPSACGAADAARVRDTATAAVRALGLRHTAAHPELMMTGAGPVVIEVAARVGGFRAQLTRHALGVDLDAAAIAVALGDPVDLTPRHRRAATAVEVWPARAGRVRRHPHADDVRAWPGIAELAVRLAPGDVYRPPPEGQRALATFYAVAGDPAASLALANAAMERLEAVELDPA